MGITNRAASNIRDSEQEVLNKSQDTKYDVLAVEMLAENPGGTALDRLKTNSEGELRVVSGGHVSTANSTSDTLGVDGVFTGTSEDVTDAAIIIINVKSSNVSATNGLSIQFSPDGTNWDNTDDYTVPAATGKTFSCQPAGQYMRVVYTNNGVEQTYFRLQTIIKHSNTKPSSHKVQSSIIDDDDAELVMSVPKLRTAQDTYVSGSATNLGNYKISLEEWDGTLATNGVPTQMADSASIDAFGRARVSDTAQRFDLEFIYDKQPLLVDEVISGNATATHNANTRDVTLDVVETNDGTSVALYSHYDIPYTAGNSQLVDITGTLDDSDIGGGTAFLFVRTSISGSVAETTYEQTNWDNPVADVDWTTSQIFQMDFQSLKVGRIRFNLVRDGLPVKLHEVTNDNIRDSGYWQNPTLPIYWRVYNDATYTYMEMGYGDTTNAIGIRYRISANADTTMRAICATVKSEGGEDLFDMHGFPNVIGNNTTGVTASTTLVPILSIRPKTTFNSLGNRVLHIPESWAAQVSNNALVKILYRPSLTGASWTDVDTTNSSMEYDVSASAVSGGILIDQAYITTGVANRAVSNDGLLGRNILSLGRTGTSDILTLAAIRTGSNDAVVLSSIKWKEIR